MTLSDKRKKLQCLMKQNHMILTTGCGARKCRVINCVSSGKVAPMDADVAFKAVVEIATQNKATFPDVLSSHIIFSLVKHTPEPHYCLLNPLLADVFSDPQKLANSFTQISMPTPQEIVTIDKDEVDEAYECLFALDNNVLDELICTSFGKMVEALQKMGKEKPKEMKYLINSVIIFLLNPKLQNPEYAQGCFADFCGCLSVLRTDFKLNIIHYISTLSADTITTMIYNFQQVIAIGIAMREDEDGSLHNEKPVCDGVVCLQLLYGAVIYRAQHTIPQFLGDLSLSKQVSLDLKSPISPYANHLVQLLTNTVITQSSSSSSQTPDILSSTNPPNTEPTPSNETITDQKQSSVSSEKSSNEQTVAKNNADTAVIGEKSAENNLNTGESSVNDSGSDASEGITKPSASASKAEKSTEPPKETPAQETSENGAGEGSPSGCDTESDEVTPPPVDSTSRDRSDEETTESLPSDIMLQVAEDGSSITSPPDGNVRELLFAEVDSDSENSEDPDSTVDALANLLNLRFSLFGGSRGRRENAPHKSAKLFTKLGIDPLWDSHTDIDLSIFYNENISEDLKMDEDYLNYKMDKGYSFLRYPYILKPHVKSVGLQFDNRINMTRLANPFQLLMSGGFPYLKLVINRARIIEDALTHLEMVAEEDPSQLQRQLYVEFDGEEGVDEGGVQKEFFQLIIAELFKPDYGMFLEVEDTKMLWFNPQSFELEHNYKLIGMLLGLAVYNNVILDIRFPTVLYQKLMGQKPDIRDLIQSHPLLGSSLQQLVDYPGDDVEEVFVLDYVASTTGLFGSPITHELIENGVNTPVTNDNRYDFVNKYVDYVLNTSVNDQFEQFKKGFDMVTANSQLREWFRPEELEKVIVGTPELDFKALESITHYDGGYSTETPLIKWFWEIVHAMVDDDKCKLLAFSTGCGRAPVGGMVEMNFIVVKNGDDSERLPTAHTCFNVLLLPEYATKDRLRQKLYTAIQHFEGFGMI